MPWRRGYAPLPDDPETAVGPRARSGSHHSHHSHHDVADNRGELHDDVVGLLDCVDPEVGTVNHLQNMTNAIMFPPIPGLYSRRPNVCLSNDDDEDTVPTLASQPKPAKESKLRLGRHRAESAPVSLRPPLASQNSDEDLHRTATEDAGIAKVELDADDKLRAHVDEDMTHELDAHMRKVLLRRKRRDKLKSALRGLWAYLKTPMGIVTAIYGFLVAFWGAAIVLFLLGWIPTSSKHAQDKWVEISSQVTNGLFTVTGVGLIPWRAIDTYRMSRIWMLRSRVRKRRAKLGLSEIKDWNDLPDPATVPGYVNVLSEKEQAELEHQQSAFQASQTWYRPHATPTHTAFPMAWALWNTILMDLNSFFQCILCGCMWGMNYHVRPPWTTGTLIPLSFLCGIGAAILIWQGGVRTKKTKEVENKLSKALGVEGPPSADVEKGRPRAATVGTERPSLDVKPKPLVEGRAPARRATVDVAPGSVTVSHLAPLAEMAEMAEMEEMDSPEPSPGEKHVELGEIDLALPPVPEISAIELPGLNPKRAST